MPFLQPISQPGRPIYRVSLEENASMKLLEDPEGNLQYHYYPIYQYC